MDGRPAHALQEEAHHHPEGTSVAQWLEGGVRANLPEPETELEAFGRASTSPMHGHMDLPPGLQAGRAEARDALGRTSTVMGHELTRTDPWKLVPSATASSSDSGGATRQQSLAYLQHMAEQWDPKVEFFTVWPEFRCSWYKNGFKDEDDDHRMLLQHEDEFTYLLERLGYQHECDAEQDCALKIEDAMEQIGPDPKWNADDYKHWWLKQSKAAQQKMVAHIDTHAQLLTHAQRHPIAVDETIYPDDVDGRKEAGEDDRHTEAAKSNKANIIDQPREMFGKLGRDVVTSVGQDLGAFHRELREIDALRALDNLRIYVVDGGMEAGRDGVQQFPGWVEWFCTAPCRLGNWVEKRVELNDETSTADWWKIFVLQMFSHCLPPLLFWRGFRIRVRKQYADPLADKAACDQMKGKRWEQLIWWFVLVSLIWLRSNDHLPSFLNSEIALNVTLWVFLALVRSEKEASRDMVSRDHTPTDLGTQVLGAVDQFTNDQASEDSVKISAEGFPQFASLAGKISRRRAAHERLQTSEHRLLDLKEEYIAGPKWDTFRAFDFRHEYEDSLGDVLSDGAEGTLREFFDEMVVSLMPYAPKVFKTEFRDLAEPRPGDPANKQTPTFKGWTSTKDGRYTDCLIRLRQADVGHLRSRPSRRDGASRDFVGKSNDRTRAGEGEDLDRAAKLDKRLRECEARHEDIKQAQKLLDKLVAGSHMQQHLYGSKTVILLTLIALFCLWLGDDSEQTRLDGDDAVSDRLRNIKSGVLHASGDLVEPLGIGAEIFTWIGYICGIIVLGMLWLLALKPFCIWVSRTRCWRWATCRANKTPEQALLEEVMKFFGTKENAGTPASNSAPSDRAESKHKAGRVVQISADEESDLFPLAKYSSSLKNFPEKHMWTYEQAKRYLIGGYGSIDDTPPSTKLLPSKVNQEKTENDLNPPYDRCRNVLRMLKLDAKLRQQVEKKMVERKAVDQKKVEQDELKKLIGVPCQMPELLAAELDAILESDGLLRSRTPTLEGWKLALATWIDLQMWSIHDEFTRHVESLKKKCRREGYRSLLHTQQTDQRIPASLVAMGIVGLSQAYAHKCVVSGYYGRNLIVVFALLCAASPYLHYLFLGCKEFEFESLRQCAFSPPAMQDGSWTTEDFSNASFAVDVSAANATELVDPSQQCADLQPPFCEEVEFCAPRIEVRTCNPSNLEKFCHVVAGIVECMLIYTIFSDILVVLERFWMAQRQMEYFSQITPWPGMQSHLRFQHYGLLPTFELKCPENIRAWNKIRIYLCSFNKDIFAREQLIVTYAFLLTMVASIIKIVGICTGSVYKVADDDPEIVDTMAIKVIILQVLSGFFVGSILWTGVQTTRLQEHGLRHVLMLSKAQHYHHAGTLFFSGAKTATMLVPHYATIGYLQKQIERKLGIPVAHQRIDSYSADDPLSTLRTLNPAVRRKLQTGHEKARDDLLKKKQALVKPFGVEERNQLAWLQDMQWRYDQMATLQELQQNERNAMHETPGDHAEDHAEVYEDVYERHNWLCELLNSQTCAEREAKSNATDLDIDHFSSPRLNHRSAQRFAPEQYPENKDPDYSVRICGLRATWKHQRHCIEEELRQCFGWKGRERSDGGSLLIEAPAIHRGKRGPFDCWATLTFKDKKDAQKVLKYGLRGCEECCASIASMDAKPCRRCHRLPLKTQNRWSSWLCDPDPLTGSNGVLDVQRQTFQKGASVRNGIKRCKEKHLKSGADSSTQAEPFLKYQIEVQDGQDIKLRKVNLESSDRTQKLDDGVLVVEYEHTHSGADVDVAWGVEGVGDVDTSWRRTGSLSAAGQYNQRFGADSPRSDSSRTSESSELSSQSVLTESSIGSIGATSPSSPNAFSSLVDRLPQSPQESDRLTLEPAFQRDWQPREESGRSTGEIISRSSRVDESSVRQEKWMQKEQLGYMLDALADVMEEERIPPNLRHLPTVEDTRPTIELPWYGPVPLTGLLFSTTLGLLTTGLGTTATAIYGSIHSQHAGGPG